MPLKTSLPLSVCVLGAATPRKSRAPSDWYVGMAEPVFRTIVAVALGATTLATPINSHAGASKHPEYHKVWEDGALRKPPKKGLKAKAPHSGLPTAKRQYKEFTPTKPQEK